MVIYYDDQDALLIFLNFPVGSLDGGKRLNAVFDLEETMIEVVEKSGIGKFDGNEFCEGPNETSVTFFYLWR